MNNLRRDLILTAFTLTETDPFSVGIQLPNQFDTSNDIREQRQVVSEMLTALEITDPQIDRFFEDVETTLRTLAGQNLESLINEPTGQKLISEWLRIQPQLAQIGRIVKIVEKYDNRIRRAHAEIDRFLELINRFLSDSGKRLEFQASGRLRVFYGSTQIKGIAGLSSGERQLVVILTHLAFNPATQKANVLIIDEPELSLHVKWQEMFVDALETANQDVQFILATHSPSIIMDRTNDCVDVSGVSQ
jgi:ATPase subunit of ABC transporter with duplicated ATPase domains